MNRRDALKSTAMILGYAITGSAVTALMQSCGRGEKLSWTPQLLSQDQAKILAALVDRILPRTDTPGALDVGTDEFIDKILVSAFPEKIQKGFASGLDSFNTTAKSLLGKDFTKLDNSKKDEVIKHFEEKSEALPGALWAYNFAEGDEFPFYRMMKELALLGYFHSEKIGKAYLAYDPIPGPFKGCIDYSDVGKAWTE
ncbi:gluconate 2-dehydrogenase subunit 3 family protein [Cecembia rubra]|uniref:Gluconate 2-dehydrogenase subunit 3-like protein n=1 Tax=Cecembia rubra TaxID=1485585 RepID=A0A2P8E1N4_9BACT|nr:gluconate 2-dehydrogenase subunit 3 family protein [Cecembia rubra]PSL03317.1 gluconate 2-dehydrogenase subunit 3-like protein [Cecembia rubra]